MAWPVAEAPITSLKERRGASVAIKKRERKAYKAKTLNGDGGFPEFVLAIL